jgi:hypothetical protein
LTSGDESYLEVGCQREPGARRLWSWFAEGDLSHERTRSYAPSPVLEQRAISPPQRHSRLHHEPDHVRTDSRGISIGRVRVCHVADVDRSLRNDLGYWTYGKSKICSSQRPQPLFGQSLARVGKVKFVRFRSGFRAASQKDNGKTWTSRISSPVDHWTQKGTSNENSARTKSGS